MPLLPTSDLRSTSKGYQRDKNHDTKWARGGRTAPGKKCEHDFSFKTNDACVQCAARPMKRDSAAMNIRAAKLRGQSHRVKPTQRAVVHEVDEANISQFLTSDTSDDEVLDPSAAPITDVDIMYSYDAKSSPSAGNDILGNAVMRAVVQFENKQTEQLIKKEYDLVLDGHDEDSHAAGKMDDDFEMIDYSHLE